MKYTCPHCSYKMPALEADAAWNGCPSCRKRIEWDDWLDSEELDKLEDDAYAEREVIRQDSPFHRSNF